MATMHYFWMKFDCLQPVPPAGGVNAAAPTAAPGSKEVTGGTVRSSGGGGPGGGPGGVQGTGSHVQGGTVRQGGGGSGSGGGTGPQGAGSDGGAVTLGGTVRSRAETGTAKAGIVAFSLLHDRAGGIIGSGQVSFYSVAGQAATRFPDEAAALHEKSAADFKRWLGNSVAVLTCIETP